MIKHPTKAGQKCRIIKTSSPRGIAVGVEVETRWPHRELLRMDKFENGQHSVEEIGIVWRVQGDGLVNVPKHPGASGHVPANQADFPAVWLEVIDEVDPPKVTTTHDELENS